MSEQELEKRQAISRLMREAANIFTRTETPDIRPALPKMEAAVHLASQLNDKTPLVICEANLASMNAVCGMGGVAMEHIQRAMEIVREHDLLVSIRNFAFTKFVEISILTGMERERALTISRGLIECAINEEGNFQQYLATLFNLAIVSSELLGEREWALALLSWIVELTCGDEIPITAQASHYYEKVAERLPGEERATILSEVEANRDAYIEQAAGGYFPAFPIGIDESNDG